MPCRATTCCATIDASHAPHGYFEDRNASRVDSLAAFSSYARFTADARAARPQRRVGPIAQAEAFAAAAKRAGAKVELVVLENAAHAFLLRGYGEPDTMRLALKHAAQFLGDP